MNTHLGATLKSSFVVLLIVLVWWMLARNTEAANSNREKVEIQSLEDEKIAQAWSSIGAPLLRMAIDGIKVTDTVGIQQRLADGSVVLICRPILISTFLAEDGKTVIAEVTSTGPRSGLAAFRLRWLLSLDNLDSPLIAKKRSGPHGGCIVARIVGTPVARNESGRVASDVVIRGTTSGKIHSYNEPPNSL